MRRWGYYVLPVFYGDRFVARINSWLDKGIWTISHWWWEDDVIPNAEMLAALRTTIGQFMHYLHAHDVRIDAEVDATFPRTLPL